MFVQSVTTHKLKATLVVTIHNVNKMMEHIFTPSTLTQYARPYMEAVHSTFGYSIIMYMKVLVKFTDGGLVM